MGRIGFTLVELLVVIVIVGLLVALVLPALAGGRASARRLQCLVQLQQVGVGFVAYAGDNRNYLPRSSHSAAAFKQLRWGPALMYPLTGGRFTGLGDPAWIRLFNGIYRCPADERRDLSWSYGKNVWYELSPVETGEPMGLASGPTYARFDLTPRPGATVLAGETAGNSAADHVMANYWLMGGQPEIDARRHGETCNFLFLDGHARAQRFEESFNLSQSTDDWNPGTAQ